MPDPLTLTVLGAAATEGIKFLYGQASAVIAAWRERRQSEGAGAPEASLRVPIMETDVLDGVPQESVIDATVVAHEERSIVKLLGVLAPYAQGLADVEPTDEELGEQAGRLRALLEAAYGQRLTFRGERREPTGARVTVSQVLGDVEGRVTGARGDVGAGGDLAVTQQAKDVKGGAEVTGFEGNVGRP